MSLTLVFFCSLHKPNYMKQKLSSHHFFLPVRGILFYGALLLSINVIKAQGTWTQKADFEGTARYLSTGFSVGGQGYIGLGYDGASAFPTDFWQYDPVAGTWTQEANFPGSGRAGAVGFSIGAKGYIGTGVSSGTDVTDFWEYDPSTNSWAQKTDFQGIARSYPVGFSVGGKGYVGTGFSAGGEYLKDFWEYDPSTDKWTQKADFGGTARFASVGLGIEDKGYIGTGGGISSLFNDFWEYNPANDEWTQKANFGGVARQDAAGFGVGNKGYIGTGRDATSLKDFWEYDPTADNWTRKSDFGGGAWYGTARFSIDSKGYIGTGVDNIDVTNSLWEYDPAGVPTCANATDLFTTHITASRATLNWVSPTDPEKWQVQYKKANSNARWNNIRLGGSRRSVNISSINANQTFKWRIRAKCTDAWNSYTDVVRFRTPSQQLITSSTQESLQLKNVPEEKLAAIKLYPNPTKGQFIVELHLANNLSTNAKIQLINMMGQTVSAENASVGNGVLQKSISISSSLSSGIYLVKVIINNKEYLTKLVYEK
jgi:N-acetylneuraminic acid mutarotase